MAPQTSSSRIHIKVKGIVQGVGFRPFVYNLAQSLKLTGYVFNSSSGVTMEVEGEAESVGRFLAALRDHPPTLSQITDIHTKQIEPLGEETFVIRESLREEGEFVLISPDVGTCEDCWRDFGDRSNRRYGYAFTNCTNCGPRYTIIEDIPYDRAKTTMSLFRMCVDCQAEYEDPTNRRFHAQPNACPVCGPSLRLIPSSDESPTVDFSGGEPGMDVPSRARALLQEGKILAVRGLGGYLFACDATNEDAVKRLRTRKRRSEKPFALMARDVAAVETFCLVSEEERSALLHPRRSIVILRRKPGTTLPEALAPGNATLGVMLPYTPLHYLLFSDTPEETPAFQALVMTSGNFSEEPIVISNEEAWARLRPVADWFLSHNRGIYMRADDSVSRTFEGKERVLRRSRGYVPQTIELNRPYGELLAFGGELKNTLCLLKDRYAILSQHIGDLENYETMVFFEETLRNLKKLFRVDPRAVAYDLHPGYMSTRLALAYAAEFGLEQSFGIQHHHAHIASCMAENHLEGKVIGVAWDGTGYGTDGAAWGGEFLVADLNEFERRAHLRYVALPGGDAAVRHPWRMALSYLRDALGESVSGDLGFLTKLDRKEVNVVEQMLAKKIHTVPTSSSGRLFDAVAAILGLGESVTFEGQAAIALEARADREIRDCYDFSLSPGEPVEVDFRPMIAAIVKDAVAGIAVSVIAARFHNTLSAAIVEVCTQLRTTEGLQRVCLSGGTFQNMYLLERVVPGLRSAGFEVFLHAAVPCNDGGLSLGQAVIAGHRLLH